MQFSLTFDRLSPLPEIRRRLVAVLGPQQDEHRHDPLSQLVKAMISSETRDNISLPAFERLERRYASWHDLSRALPADIENIIQPVTRAEVKAVQLPQALRMIAARNGDLDLQFLADWEEEMATQWLRGLPGVGPKIAAAVLNFSTLRRRTLAVDRHLLRVGKRLGLLPQAADYDSGYDAFMRLVPDDWDADDCYEFHWLMKYWSQRICTHAAPACALCRLQDLCPRRIAPSLK